jgi:hypothetical protein
MKNILPVIAWDLYLLVGLTSGNTDLVGGVGLRKKFLVFQRIFLEAQRLA